MATVTRRPYPRSVLSMVDEMEKPAAPKKAKKVEAVPVKTAAKKKGGKR